MKKHRLRSITALLGQVWSLAAPYWRSEERWRAAGLLAAIIALTLGLVYILVLITDWNRVFYNALEQKDFAAFQELLLRFCGLVTIYIAGAVAKLYLTQLLEINWRTWLTRRYVRDWLANRAYYRLELHGRESTDNPDQRIADDLRLFTAGALGLGLGLFSSVVTLVSFVAVLWSISGALTVPLGQTEIVIPGYMVWAAVGYALVGSLLTHWVGRRLVGLNFQQERYEADFRFGLVRLRENAEGVALYGGEEAERLSLFGRFDRIRGNWRQLMRYTVRLTTFTVGYNQIAIVFPIVVAAPQYFASAITLGGLMQISSAFGRVQDALSWFVNSYDGLAPWKASVDRLVAFNAALDRAGTTATGNDRIAVAANGASGLRADAIDLTLPSGRILLAGVSLDIAPGDRVLLQGPSGSGKSTLFRAMAGIWPYGRGTIHVPADARTLFLPQKPYIPLLSLRDAVAYPAPGGSIDDDAVREALIAVGLATFVFRLNETRNWSLELSGGEQQRLAVARALLHRPDWLFLDEATSALDPVAEEELHAALRQRLPHATIVSVAHHPEAAGHYDRTIELAAGRVQPELVTA